MIHSISRNNFPNWLNFMRILLALCVPNFCCFFFALFPFIDQCLTYQYQNHYRIVFWLNIKNHYLGNVVSSSWHCKPMWSEYIRQLSIGQQPQQGKRGRKNLLHKSHNLNDLIAIIYIHIIMLMHRYVVRCAPYVFIIYYGCCFCCRRRRCLSQ